MRHLIIYIMVLVGITLCSCERRPIEEEFTDGQYCDILLVSDWSLLGEVPTGMSAIFYPMDGGTPIRLMSNNTSYNTVRLRKGRYNILIFNQSENEFSTLAFQGMDRFATAEAMLRPLKSGNQSTADDYAWFYSLSEVINSGLTAYREPEFFNVETIENYVVTDEMAALQALHPQGDRYYADTIFVTPPPVVPSLHITISVTGIENCRRVKAYITDMAGSQYIGRTLNSPKSACQVMTSWKKNVNELLPTTGTVSTDIRTFGVPGMYIKISRHGNLTPARTRSQITDEDIANHLHVFFELRDGKTIVPFTWDVTEDMEYYETELRLNLELDQRGTHEGDPDIPGPIVLPDVPDDGKGDGSGAGFDADVEDWEHTDEDIQM